MLERADRPGPALAASWRRVSTGGGGARMKARWRWRLDPAEATQRHIVLAIARRARVSTSHPIPPSGLLRPAAQDRMSLSFHALQAKCPYCAVLYMQSVLIISCFICKASFLFRVLHARSVLMISCLICKVSLLFRALYAKCPYYFVLYMQSVLIIKCVICNVSLLLVVLCMQSVFLV